MKLRLLAIAASLVVATSTHALTPAQLDAARIYGTLQEITFTGSSSLRLTLAAAFLANCDTSTTHVFWNNALGDGHRAYSCYLAKAVGNYPAGTPVLFYKRDAGGSGQGVGPVSTNALTTHMVVDNRCVDTYWPNFSDFQIANYTCPGTSNRIADAGISDVEPSLLNTSINLPDNTPGNPQSGTAPATNLSNMVVQPFVQAIYGVAINLRAYRALQATQGLPLDDLDANRPSLPTAWVRSALTGGLSASNSFQRGWGMVISPSVDAAAHTKTHNVCRRQPSSGTQAASNAYFAQAPCAGLFASTPMRQTSATAPNHVATGTTYVVNEGSSSANVETCIGTTVEGVANAYGLGVLSRENNPKVNNGDKGYRFVKLDGRQPVRFDPDTGKGATTGEYDFVYESTILYNSTNPNLNADKIAFINAIRIATPKPAGLGAIDVDVQQGVMSPAATWAPAQYPTLSIHEKLFASRVGRVSNASCSILKLMR